MHMSLTYQTCDYSKTAGQFHSIKGTAVEAVRVPFPFFFFRWMTDFQQVGNVTGSESWQSSGRDEHATGEAEYNAAQAQGFVQGAGDRVAGYKDSVVGSVTGDKGQQVSGIEIHVFNFFLKTNPLDLLGNVQQERGKVQQQANQPWSSS
jgi:uncharacterized protein YjbJ (UPF0337 family)